MNHRIRCALSRTLCRLTERYARHTRGIGRSFPLKNTAHGPGCVCSCAVPLRHISRQRYVLSGNCPFLTQHYKMRQQARSCAPTTSTTNAGTARTHPSP